MKKFQQINLFIYLNGFLIFEFLTIYPNKIFAKDLRKSNLIEINLNTPQYEPIGNLNVIQISTGSYISKNDVIEDLKANGDSLFNLLAFEQKDIGDDFFVEIDSDTQYRENNEFIAEGNVTIFLSDATLQGDLVKYDLENKLLTVIGNVTFKKGKQYFEASELSYDLKQDIGYIDNVYGLLDSKTFAKDFELEINKNQKIYIDMNNEINNPKFINSATIGLENDFEDDKSLNITKADLKIPTISRWRFKTDKLTYNSKTFESKKIFFTNDIYNQPQFVFLSKNFSAEIIENKLRLLSRNSWIILDNKIKIPVGRQSVYDSDPITSWGFGADFRDKDGYFLFRSTDSRKIFRDYDLQIQPYFLIQRYLQDYTESYTAKNSSVFSEKVRNDINFFDNFALDLNLSGREKDWNVGSKIELNSLNIQRLDESLRTKLTLRKRIFLEDNNGNESLLENSEDLNDYIDIEESGNSNSLFNDQAELNLQNIYSYNDKNENSNILDIQLYNVFRENIEKDFATEQIYFASGINFSNKRKWSNNGKISNLSLIYDFGHFKSKALGVKEFNELFRNSFVALYGYKFPIWEKANLDTTIDESYKYSHTVIRQSLDWATGVKSGYYIYSDGTNQSALKFNTGPVITLGGLKKDFLDYTKFSANYTYVFKTGESPFSFDNISKLPTLYFNFQQQIYGPLIFSLTKNLNLEKGTYYNVKYALDLKRRAYKLSAYYNSKLETVGIKFNLYNFDYSGLSPKF